MPAASDHGLASTAGSILRDASIVFLVVLLAALFGILTRPVGFLASVWPANAILLGLMVRNPALSTPAGWAAAFAGYIAADLLTGGGLAVTLWLTIANIAGASTAYLLFMRCPVEHRQLRQPLSIVSLFAICALAAGVAGLVGGGAARLLFDRDLLTGFTFWFTTEMVNMIIFLPVILTWPASGQWTPSFARQIGSREWMPATALAVSIVASVLSGGPGAFAYPIPALLWCALTYSLFGTAVLTACFSIVQLINATPGAPSAQGDELAMSISIRLAIALMALGPIAVASIDEARAELLRKLRHAVDHDALTGVLTRSAFLERGQQLLSADRNRHPRAVALMIDIDHFKNVNDLHGHAAGDKVLAETARAISGNLRHGDVVGRLGGEEFGVVLASLPGSEALAIAERIRAAVEKQSFEVGNATLKVTLSIGLALAPDKPEKCLHETLARADKALYEAKIVGRNRIVAARARAPETRGSSAA